MTPRDTTRRPAPADTGARRARRDTTAGVPIPPRPDSIKIDSTGSVVPFPAAAAVDTTAARRDSVRPPTARAESPVLLDIGPTYRWDRDALFATGAVNLADFLDRVPGLTALRGGWIRQPTVGAYLGDPGGVRVFYDGLELDPLDPRMGGLVDLSSIELWTLEEVAIERGADEVRVYLRSWRTVRTEPQTRVDIATGDEDTNLYRGFYGKRFRHGEALQFGFQQYNTRNPRFGGGGDELALLARTGIARGRWSFDAFATRSRQTRSDRKALTNQVLMPALRGRLDNAYVRAAYGDPEHGGWAQLVAGSLAFFESSPKAAGTPPIPADSADTTRSEGQYLAAVGFSGGGARLSATGRFRTFQGDLLSSASARASFDRRFGGVSLFAEKDARDSVFRGEAALRLRPLSVLSLAGVMSYAKPDGATGRSKSTSLRGEGAIRLGGALWIGGGVMVRDSAVMLPPTVFDASFVSTVPPRITGSFVTVRGRVYKAVYADAWGLRWDKAKLGFYQPPDQSRAELGVRTNWLRRFPSGHFGFLLAGIHEYRGETFFPVKDADGALAAERVGVSRNVSVLLEVRIVSATLTYQLRNAVGEIYETVPGYIMPRTVNFYGIRWNFAN